MKKFSYVRRDLDSYEEEKHFLMKKEAFDWIFENTEFYVMTELQQIKRPWFSFTDAEKQNPIFYRMDICAIRPSDCQVFDIEIDGNEHYTAIGRMKDNTRDGLLKLRYGALVHRIDKDEDSVDIRALNIFLNSKSPPKNRQETYSRKVTTLGEERNIYFS